MTVEMSEERVTVTLSPGAVRDGETFVMVWSLESLAGDELATSDPGDGVRTVSGFASKVTAEVTADRVPPCRVVSTPSE